MTADVVIFVYSTHSLNNNFISRWYTFAMFSNKIKYFSYLVVGILSIISLFIILIPAYTNDFNEGMNRDELYLFIALVYGLFVAVMTFLRLKAIGRSRISAVIPSLIVVVFFLLAFIVGDSWTVYSKLTIFALLVLIFVATVSMVSAYSLFMVVPLFLTLAGVNYSNRGSGFTTLITLDLILIITFYALFVGFLSSIDKNLPTLPIVSIKKRIYHIIFFILCTLYAVVGYQLQYHSFVTKNANFGTGIHPDCSYEDVYYNIFTFSVVRYCH